MSNLQGVMGREYALAPGEPADAAEAIGEHYRPRFAGDEVPHSRLGKLLAIADKLDTVVACFAVGIVPTGSADPYGLRREASGVVAILLSSFEEREERRLRVVALGKVTDVSLEALRRQVSIERSDGTIRADVATFFQQRLETQLRDEGVPYDIVNAVLAAGADDIGYAAARAYALRIFKEHPSFTDVVNAATRVANITRGFAGGQVNPDLLTDGAERELWDACQRVEEGASIYSVYVTLADVSNKLVEYLEKVSTGLGAPIDRFFDDVLVMAEDEKVRNNRLALCRRISQLFRQLADFTLIVQA
jgi:glycyl-tRNA synthetase beta chain